MPGSSPAFLLIGAGGLVGRHLREALANEKVVSTYHRQPDGDGFALDITNSDDVRRTIRTHRPGVIVLAAADPWVERCEREPEVTRRVNVDAARMFAEEAERLVVAGHHKGLFHVAGPQVWERAAFARQVALEYGLPASLIEARPTSELGSTAPRPRRAGLATRKLGHLGVTLVDPRLALQKMATSERA